MTDERQDAAHRAVLPLFGILAGCLALLVVGLWVKVAHQPKADPWVDTKYVVARACNVSVADLRYGGGDYDHDLQGHAIGEPWAVKFSAPGHPVIFVPYDPQVGFQGVQSEVRCDGRA